MSDSDEDTRGPLHVTFRDFTPENEAELRLLNSVIFPIRYSDKFYVECAAAGKVTQLPYALAYIGAELVGAIACRLELLPDRSGARMYIMTVGVLAPYRNGAVGTRLLQHALNEGSADGFIVDAYLHVQTSNDDAIAFYKRFGFVGQLVPLYYMADQVVQNYYKRLDPPDAVILKLNLKDWKAIEIAGVEYETGGGDCGGGMSEAELMRLQQQQQQQPPPSPGPPQPAA